MTFSEAGPVLGQGAIAQQIFWYTAFTAGLNKPGLPVVNADGTPKWRMAPSPHGPCGRTACRTATRTCGSWTMLNTTPSNDARRLGSMPSSACKSTSLKKTLVGLTPIRQSDIRSQPMTDTRQAGRPRRVLSQPGPGRLDADRNQRAGLSEAGPAVLAERRLGGDRREDAPGGDGQSRQGNGQGPGPARARRHEELRAQAQSREGSQGVAERQGGALGKVDENPKGETVAYESCCRPGRPAGSACHSGPLSSRASWGGARRHHPSSFPDSNRQASPKDGVIGR